jgi:phosphoglucosamine mutase
VMAAVEEDVTEKYESVSTLDGVRVERDDGWFLLRASGTQPLVRITAEARTESRTAALFEEAKTCLERASE